MLVSVSRRLLCGKSAARNDIINRGWNDTEVCKPFGTVFKKKRTGQAKDDYKSKCDVLMALHVFALAFLWTMIGLSSSRRAFRSFSAIGRLA